jgi:hypothetical protein
LQAGFILLSSLVYCLSGWTAPVYHLWGSNVVSLATFSVVGC